MDLISPESRLITRVLFRPNELNELEIKGFDPEVLSLPYATAFREITRMRVDHDDMPSASHLLKLSPNIQIQKTCPKKKATVYWEVIYKGRWRGEIHAKLLGIKGMLPDDVPDEALMLSAVTDEATKAFSELSARYSFDAGRPALLGELTEVLRKEYEKLERGETVGVPIPFEFLAAELIGWKFGRIYVVAGRPKTGKSWVALISSTHAMLHGMKVLFVSLEMTQEELSKRLACILGNISYNEVVKGKLSPKDRKMYFAFLEELKNGKLGKMIKIVGPGQAKTPEAVGALGKAFNASLVVVDAFYRGMIDGTGEKSYEQIRSLMHRYGAVSLPSNAAWMLTTQFNRQVKGRGSAILDNLAFGDAIGMDANGMIYLVRDAYLKKARQVDIILGEAREADDIRAFRHNWNFITMDWSKVGAVEYGGDSKGLG